MYEYNWQVKTYQLHYYISDPTTIKEAKMDGGKKDF